MSNNTTRATSKAGISTQNATGVNTDVVDKLEQLKKKQETIRSRVLARRTGELPTTASLSEGGTQLLQKPVSPSPQQQDKASDDGSDEPQSDGQQQQTLEQQAKRLIVECLLDPDVVVPIDSVLLLKAITKKNNKDVETPSGTTPATFIETILKELQETHPGLLEMEDLDINNSTRRLVILNVDKSKLLALSIQVLPTTVAQPTTTTRLLLSRKRNSEQLLSPDDSSDSSSSRSRSRTPPRKSRSTPNKEEDIDIDSLLNRPSIRERERAKVGNELAELLEKETVKEKSLMEKLNTNGQQFKSKGGPRVTMYCTYGTREECKRERPKNTTCGKIHFRRIIKPHTEAALGDCSYLDTCRHMKTCKFVHYELEDAPDGKQTNIVAQPVVSVEPQWVNCDIRSFDMSLLGQFSVIMADPPWDIHMELPYGTLTDDEMRSLNVGPLQDEGFFFLWVTGRAMELGRECLELWGVRYERVEEIIWVKTNQLQRIIRTGRTGHWLNHSKEHCLVGIKGKPQCHRFIDCDVVVAEVRETSRKPDEIYGLIERLAPAGSRKLELFGRPHNTHPGWTTLGNQLEGVNIKDEDMKKKITDYLASKQ